MPAVRRATQTNEPARCAVLLPLLHRIGGPIALIELGASAGLCLIPDRYSTLAGDLPEPVTVDTAFVAALDRVPFALANGHADTMTVLGPGS